MNGKLLKDYFGYRYREEIRFLFYFGALRDIVFLTKQVNQII